MVADELARRGGLSWRGAPRLRGETSSGRLGSQSVIVLKPQTYMNVSGESVGAAVRFFRVDAAQVIAIHDDVDLELGRLKIKRGGGDGGHKGLRSITQHLGGSSGYIRIRVGVGRPEFGEVSDHVLADFRREEAKLVDAVVGRSADAVQDVMICGLTEAMNQHNAFPREPQAEEGD
jgi:PTH1 family peptidyl-tRNA hydrolase